ncbi:MAG: COX15/CtaA family protein [Burkholderiales bacterium]|nr:COX15/CtaA family protein [Burkholderiales bacterium]
MSAATGYDLAPLLGVAALGLALALGPLAWFWTQRRHAAPGPRLRALALLTLFLSFDLVLLGAFTRLSDSGLGCPDWPGCYGHASPLGASAHIAAAQAAVPTGPVTHGKAWIEMAHRYSAAAIGVLVIALAVLAIFEARRRRVAASPAWALATLVWILAQGAFGALTVTMKLYPAIVTLHLLGGLGLLALLAIQAELYEPRTLALSPGLRRGIAFVAGLAVLQIALGGWVSTNYAVLACSEFPTCQGAWWPEMRFDGAFELRRQLGGDGDGGLLPFAGLTAIHMVHRLGAFVVLPSLVLLAWRLAAGGDRAARPWGIALAGIAAWQTASGLGNVLLGWPLVAAVAHTAGAAALVVVFTILIVRAGRSQAVAAKAWPGVGRRLAS